MGNFIVLGILAVIIGYAVHAVWKSHRNGSCCGCDGHCGHCKGCH